MLNRFKPSCKIFYWPFQGGASFVDLLWFFCLVFAMPLCASVYLCLVVTCWERADLLALICHAYQTLECSTSGWILKTITPEETGIGECHATDYAFLRLWYKFKVRKFSSFVRFSVSLSLSHWYPGSGGFLIVSILDICTLTYFVNYEFELTDEALFGV